MVPVYFKIVTPRLIYASMPGDFEKWLPVFNSMHIPASCSYYSLSFQKPMKSNAQRNAIC